MTAPTPPPDAKPDPFLTRFLREVKLEVGDFLTELKAVPVVIFIVAGVALWAFHYYGGNDFFDDTLRPWLRTTSIPQARIALMRCCYWSFTALLLLTIIPHLTLKTTLWIKKDSIPTLGWGLGDWRVGLAGFAIFYGAMIPILLSVAWTPDFREHYPSCSSAGMSWQYFLIYETCYALFFCWWEYFFRGFLTLGLEKTFGFWAVFIQMLPFVVAHFDKPSLETLSSVFGGIFLGYLALRTRSFWYGAATHAATAVTLDVIAFTLKHH